MMRKTTQSIICIIFLCLFIPIDLLRAQDMPTMWDTHAAEKEHGNIKWFKDAKFGIFVHWGLYSQLAGSWEGKRYYGSGEWLMFQAKAPVAKYAAEAEQFNPVNFNAKEWVSLAKEAGAKYFVVTAKHHEGFAMFNSKHSEFSITKKTPFKRDPMMELAHEAQAQHMPFGFYYSQFLDWHEPDGGGNDWDFKGQKDYLKYYREKSIPQLKELMTGYGKLGLVWFDMPGGMNKEQTKSLIDTLHALQPDCLFSSRVGQGLGDYIDLGDSEMPPAPIKSAWEAIYTFNDSWGYIDYDLNFKSPKEIVRLIAQASSKGGNLMLNIGPDGKGNIPQICIDFLKETGIWMKKNGESIYGTTFGFIPPQPWGVTTTKPGKLFLHLFERPLDNRVLVPSIHARVKNVKRLNGEKVPHWEIKDGDLSIVLSETAPVGIEAADEVYVVEFDGDIPSYAANLPIVVSDQYENIQLEPAQANLNGHAKVENLTFSHYFGDWKHVSCVQNMAAPRDYISYTLDIKSTGYYKVLLDYAATEKQRGREGVLQFDNRDFRFSVLPTTEQFSSEGPVPFIKHAVAIIDVKSPGKYKITLKPVTTADEFLKLKQLILEPVSHRRATPRSK